MPKASKNKMDEKEEFKITGDTTTYGEFVSTYFAWIPPSKQKDRAEELDKATKKDEKVEK